MKLSKIFYAVWFSALFLIAFIALYATTYQAISGGMDNPGTIQNYLLSTVVGVLFGLPAAWALSRVTFPGLTEFFDSESKEQQ